MATVTGMTADRMLAIEAASVVDGDVVGDNLILTKHDGSQINAGSVRGAQGVQGPVGVDTPALAAVPVLDVGLVNQIRAGRQLTAADFTNMGLSAPIGLWNLSDLTDVSGNGRNLLNKGAVPFDVGINGGAATAAKFVGSAAQALYISDTGAADPFRIRTGSIGCWFSASKRDSPQYLLSKFGSSGGTPQFCWGIYVDTTNVVWGSVGNGITVYSAVGVTDVADNKWHFAIMTADGLSVKLYIDGNLENSKICDLILPGSNPFNIGSFGADAATASQYMFSGRIDEAFVTADVLSEDQIRNLYCTKIPHTLAAVPSRISLNVHRKRKGAALTVADFPTQPLRLHNFSGGSLGDEGSNGVGLTNNGAAISVAGVDGSSGNAFNLNSQWLSSTDTGLPTLLNPRSYGFWVKTTQGSGSPIVFGGWGNAAGQIGIYLATGVIRCVSVADIIVGPWIADGIWHHIVVTEFNAVGAPTDDGIKRKLFFDGRLFGMSTGLSSIAGLGGANHFALGAWGGSTGIFVGQMDGVFVCDYALTSEQITKLYAKSLMTLASSPKNSGDHVEAMSSTNILATFDSLEMQHTVDLLVAP